MIWLNFIRISASDIVYKLGSQVKECITPPRSRSSVRNLTPPSFALEKHTFTSIVLIIPS